MWHLQADLLIAQDDLAGGMQWKTVKGHEYLVRHWNDPVSKKKLSKSLGVRSPETERRHGRYVADRALLERKVEEAKPRLEAFAERARRARVPRLPFLATRVCTQLYARGHRDGEILLINEAAAFVYGAAYSFEPGEPPRLGLTDREDVRVLDRLDLLVGAGVDRDRVEDAIVRSARGMQRQDPDTFSTLIASNVLLVTDYSLPRLLEVFERRCRPGDDVMDAIEWAFDQESVSAIAVGDDGLPLKVWAPDPRVSIFMTYALADAGVDNATELRSFAGGLAETVMDRIDKGNVKQNEEES